MFESRKAALALKLNNLSYIKMKKQERKRDIIEERSAGEEDSMQIGSKECRQIKF